MSNRTMNFLTARNSRWNLAGGILVLMFLILGCSDSGNTTTETPKKTTPPAYVGAWTAADGSTLTIRNDGSGDYKFGGKSVNGGTVEIDEAAKEIRFTMLGFDAGKYKIEQAPANNKMKLDGMEYRRTGGFDQSDTDAKTGEAPSESEMRPLVIETLKTFDQAIQKKDFTDFYPTISETWQSQTTAAELTKVFSQLYSQKTDFIPKDEASLNFSSKPAFESENTVKMEVNYPNAAGLNIRFRVRYIKESGDWKLIGIRLNPAADK